MALHVSPDALMRCDDEVLEALLPLAERARTEEVWSMELQALTAELVHAHWRLAVQANSKKGTRPPPPLRVPRPWRDGQPKPRSVRLSAAELITRMGSHG